MSAITPTVGRKVWFYADGLQKDPHDATIVKVYGSGPNAAVNLDVVDPDDGHHYFRPSIVVGNGVTTWPHYRWMPYQQAQAKAHADVGTDAAT